MIRQVWQYKQRHLYKSTTTLKIDVEGAHKCTKNTNTKYKYNNRDNYERAWIVWWPLPISPPPPFYWRWRQRHDTLSVVDRSRNTFSVDRSRNTFSVDRSRNQLEWYLDLSAAVCFNIRLGADPQDIQNNSTKMPLRVKIIHFAWTA